MEITDQVHSHREEREPPSDPEADQKRVWGSIFISHNEIPLPNFNLKRKFDHFRFCFRSLSGWALSTTPGALLDDKTDGPSVGLVMRVVLVHCTGVAVKKIGMARFSFGLEVGLVVVFCCRCQNSSDSNHGNRTVCCVCP